MQSKSKQRRVCRNGEARSFTLDPESRAALAYAEAVANHYLDAQYSAAAIVRRALHLYANHIRDAVNEVHPVGRSGESLRIRSAAMGGYRCRSEGEIWAAVKAHWTADANAPVPTCDGLFPRKPLSLLDPLEMPFKGEHMGDVGEDSACSAASPSVCLETGPDQVRGTDEAL